jgi:hypothetical protein
MKNLIISIFILGLFTIACKKYPEDPFISFRSKTERVSNNWKVGQAYDNGNDVTSDYNIYELSLARDSKASLVAKYTFMGTDYAFTTEGSWSFVSDKEKISFNFDNDNADGVYLILKLKENEMWLKKDGGTLELHFVTR